MKDILEKIAEKCANEIENFKKAHHDAIDTISDNSDNAIYLYYSSDEKRKLNLNFHMLISLMAVTTENTMTSAVQDIEKTLELISEIKARKSFIHVDFINLYQSTQCIDLVIKKLCERYLHQQKKHVNTQPILPLTLLYQKIDFTDLKRIVNLKSPQVSGMLPALFFSFLDVSKSLTPRLKTLNNVYHDYLTQENIRQICDYFVPEIEVRKLKNITNAKQNMDKISKDFVRLLKFLMFCKQHKETNYTLCFFWFEKTYGLFRYFLTNDEYAHIFGLLSLCDCTENQLEYAVCGEFYKTIMNSPKCINNIDDILFERDFLREYAINLINKLDLINFNYIDINVKEIRKLSPLSRKEIFEHQIEKNYGTASYRWLLFSSSYETAIYDRKLSDKKVADWEIKYQIKYIKTDTQTFYNVKAELIEYKLDKHDLLRRFISFNTYEGEIIPLTYSFLRLINASWSEITKDDDQTLRSGSSHTLDLQNCEMLFERKSTECSPYFNNDYSCICNWLRNNFQESEFTSIYNARELWEACCESDNIKYDDYFL